METTKLQAPEGCTGASFDGVEYEADKNGVVEVPAAAAAELLSHGFTAVKPKAK